MQILSKFGSGSGPLQPSKIHRISIEMATRAQRPLTWEYCVHTPRLVRPTASPVLAQAKGEWPRTERRCHHQPKTGQRFLY